MATISFNNLVKDFFGYLVSEFGFLITEELPSSGHPLSSGMVVYVSPARKNETETKQVRIRVILDRGYVLIDIGSIDMSNRDLIGIAEIMQLVAPEIPMNEQVDFSKSPIEILEPQVQKLSQMLYQHCKSILKGDFSLIQIAIENRHKQTEERIQDWKNSKNQKREKE